MMVGVSSPTPKLASRGQQQLWLVAMLGEGSAVYSVAAAIRFRGRLDADLLARAAEDMLAGHEALCTSFIEGETDLERVVSADAVSPLRRFDFKDLPEEPTRRESDRLGDLFAREPYSIVEGAVVRAALVEEDADRCTLLLGGHHVVFDGWTVGLLAREVADRYLALAAGRDFKSPPSPSYDDFVAAEARAREERGEEDLAWWLDYLAGAPTVFSLPTDLPRPEWQSYGGSRLHFDFGDPQRVKDLATEVGATPFTLLLACFGICLAAEADCRDLLVGIALSGRKDPEMYDLVGYCAKVLPVRIRIKEAETLVDFARDLQDAVVSVLEHDSVDLGDLVMALGISGDTARNPLVQTIFGKHDDLIPQGPVGEGTELECEILDTGSSAVDLTLLIERMTGEADAAIEYAEDVVSEEGARRFSERYVRTVGAVVADPTRSLGSLLSADLEPGPAPRPSTSAA